jgi:hypothetical protein
VRKGIRVGVLGRRLSLKDQQYDVGAGMQFSGRALARARLDMTQAFSVCPKLRSGSELRTKNMWMTNVDLKVSSNQQKESNSVFYLA